MVAVEAQQRRTGTSVGRYQLRAVDLDARPAAVIRACPPPAGVSAWLPGVVRRLGGELQRQKVPAITPLFVRPLHAASGAQVEVGYLVGEPIEDSGEVVASGLPGGPAIMAVDVWPGELEDAYVVLREWLSARGFRPSGPDWQCFREVPPSGSGRAILDIVMPYRW